MLSLILPVCNGAEHLAAAVSEALIVLPRHAASYELIIVDDGSRDSTGPLADRLAARHEPVLVTHRPQPIGFGRALYEGWRLARGSHIIATDIGGLSSLTDLGRMLAQGEHHTVVVGARLGRRTSATARIASRMAGVELYDPSHRFALVQAQVLDTLGLENLGSLAHIQLLLRARASGLPTLQVELRDLQGWGAGYGQPNLHDLLLVQMSASSGLLGRPARAIIGAGLAAAVGGAWLLRHNAGERQRNNNGH